MRPDDDAQAGVALCLGHFVSTMQWHDLSETVQHDAKRALVNFFGGARGAARHPDLTALAAVLEAFSGPREATVIGRGARLDTLSASTLNAVSANLLDYDDTHLGFPIVIAKLGGLRNDPTLLYAESFPADTLPTSLNLSGFVAA